MMAGKMQKRLKRRKRLRGKIVGSKERPRLSVFRSDKHIYAQLIDDEKGITLASASSSEIKDELTKKEKARKVGRVLAQKAIKAKIKKVAFDRGGFKYHGRVAALAEGAREGGLEF